MLTCAVAVGEGLPRATPESQGVESAGVLRFVERADAEIDAMNSFMLVRHGHVVAEGWWAPYQPGDIHQLYSLSKSFTSVAAGIAIAEGKLSVDDRVIDRLPDLAPESPSDHLRMMRVRDLLRMTTGHTAGELRKWRWERDPTVREFLALNVELKPGTHFTYNTPATYTAAAIVERAVGEGLHAYLTTRLFEPLGIEGSWWAETGEGIAMGGTGLNVRTEDIAKFGQFLLQRGEWEGRQLVPAEWVDAATRLQTPTGSAPDGDWDQGYGYQFWQSTHGYRGDGAFGQYCLVLPEHDAVVAITSGVRDMGAVMRLVWDELLPAMNDEVKGDPIQTQEQLVWKLANLSLPARGNAVSFPLAEKVAGVRYAFTDDSLGLREISLHTLVDPATFTLVNAKGRQSIPIGEYGGYGGNLSWIRSRVDSIHGLTSTGNQLVEPPSGTVAVAASGGWTAEDTYALRLCLYETPFYVDMKLHFTGDEVTIDIEQNAAFGERKESDRVGYAEK